MDLKTFWQEQIRQQANWHDWNRLTPEQRDLLSKDLLLGLDEEKAVLARRLNRDRYHILQPRKDMEPDLVAHDGVKVFKYLLALMALHGVTPDQFAENFDRETRTVDDKWRGQQLHLSSEVSAVLCDLDGCAANWCDAFSDFARSRGVRVPEDIGYNDPRLELLKDDFDRSGGYLSIKPMPGAVEALRRIHKRHKIVIVTARPYQRFQRVYADTVTWLNTVGITYDRIMFERDKAEAVRRVAPARIVGFVEDRAKHAIEVALAGARVLKMPAGSAEDITHPNIIPVTGWDDIERELARLEQEH